MLLTFLASIGCGDQRAYEVLPKPGQGTLDFVDSAVGGCGVERWAVKTGTDSDAARVNTTPQGSTVAALTQLATTQGGTSTRGANELQVYRLTNVQLLQYKLESDSDYHLVIADAAGGVTAIAEIPAPSCVSGGRFASGIQSARSAFDSRLTATGSFQTANLTVTLEGIAFFDPPHGQTGKAPNNFEMHPITFICFGANCAGGGGGGGSDFSISVSPSSQSVTQGSSVTYQVNTGVTAGAAENVSLSVSGLSTGVAARFGQSSVQSGGGTTLTLTASTTASAVTTSFTVTGSDSLRSHGAQASLTVSASGGGGGGGALVNGDFEAGSLSGWSATGSATVSSASHGGAGAAQLGSSGPSTDSTLRQTVTVPTGATVSFWYQITCPDSVQYDWATVEVRDTAGALLRTLLPHTCTNTGGWVNATADLSALAGLQVVLTFANHDDNYSGDATFSRFDDVTLAAGGGGGGGGGAAGVSNGDFEAGTLSGWTAAGAASVSSASHGGAHAALVGKISASTDSSIRQTVTVPATGATLSFWYQPNCPDTVQYDWATVQVQSVSGAVLLTALPRTCSNSGVWTPVTVDLSAYANTSVVLVFSNHDDNYSADPTYTLYDDIAVR